jgi:phosphoribosyl 1,2-cyclic phosphodiesterase
MQLTFLGTGASEGYPAPFCRCPRCEKARHRGGRSIRLRASLLVNDDLLIDYNDIVASSALYGVDVSAIETLLITHSHVDHYQPDQFFIRAFPFAITPVPVMQLYAPYDAIAMLDGRITRSPDEARYAAHVAAPGDRWTSGRYAIRAFHATHGTADPLLYAVDDGQRTLLYSTDTGLYTAETWEMIREGTYDAVVMDETMGTIPTNGGSQHLGLDAVIDYRRVFEREGLLKPGARFIAHHFSHGANPHHEDLEDLLRPHGIEVAYDGWRLEL